MDGNGNPKDDQVDPAEHLKEQYPSLHALSDDLSILQRGCTHRPYLTKRNLWPSSMLFLTSRKYSRYLQEELLG
jgi:hypothetical protein